MTPNQFLELFLSLSMQAAVLAGVTSLLCRFTHRGAVQSRLWVTWSFAVLSLVVASVLLPHPRHFAPWSAFTDQAVLEVARFEERLGLVLFSVWAAGALVVSTFLAGELIRTNEFLRTCAPVDPRCLSLDCILPDSGKNLPGGHRVQVLSSDSIFSPICWQFHRPYIVLPVSLLGLEEDQLRMILRHELEHLRTGHPLRLLMQKVVQAIFWYHPVVWWASREATLAREYACDEAAVDCHNSIAGYLRALLTVVELGVDGKCREGWSLGFSRQSTLASRSRRLVALASFGKNAARELSPRLLRGMLVAVAVMLALAWLPVDVLASSRSHWSPWPGWSSRTLHLLGIPLRDFETYDPRSQTHELHELTSQPGHRD